MSRVFYKDDWQNWFFNQEVCPLENDNTTLVVVIGGETTRENRENEHSTSIEIIGASGYQY